MGYTQNFGNANRETSKLDERSPAVSALQRSRPDRPGFSQLQKKKFGGGNLKTIKIQGWRGGSAFGWQTAGLVSQVVLFFPLHICSYLLVFVKIGSSVSVEMLQNTTFYAEVARKGGFLHDSVHTS